MREACGVFGIFAPDLDVARTTFYGLYALQHRGQESAGICTTDGGRLRLRTGMGLVSQVFDENALAPLHGSAAIGHTRYSTTGSSRARNAQPLLLQGSEGELALAHNGNVVNASQVRDSMEREGHQFHTSTDSEVIGKFLLDTPGTWGERFAHLMRTFSGAYSLALLTPDRLMAARDPRGVRPLCLGTVDGGYVVASESCAFDHIGAEFVRNIAPGELITITAEGLKSEQVAANEEPAGCVFEHIYFARPDSKLDGTLVYSSRLAMGEELAREQPADADLVIGVPDSATAAAVGYARGAGLPYAEGLVKNRYVGRTFIQPDQRLRELGVNLKFNPLREVIEGKRLIVVDDSIVRGTTTPRIVKMLRAAGAAEIHMRICAPPIRHACFFGVDMATRGELIASDRTVPEILELMGADSLGYLSLEGLVRAIGLGDRHCLACFTGDYPVPVQLEMDKMALERPLTFDGDSPRLVANAAVQSAPRSAPLPMGLPATPGAVKQSSD
ncbi:MAG: amidophosphoribosyltransferase [Chloroflexi bacterium]|nr:MAG: amidophosphoribosyltransferase [Chloroflexota bacterium]